MHKAQGKLERMNTYSRWFLTRGMLLACVMEGAALFLALVSVWGGLGHEGWVLWVCVSYLRDSGLVTLIVAPGGSLLLEDIRRDDG